MTMNKMIGKDPMAVDHSVFRGYPPSFFLNRSANSYSEEDVRDYTGSMLDALHKLRRSLLGSGYTIECELGDYVLLDEQDNKVTSGDPLKLARFCMCAELLDVEQYREILHCTRL